MPFIDDNEVPTAQPSVATGQLPAPEQYNVSDVITSAFRQDNAVFNLIDWATRPQYKPDAAYTTEKLKQRPEFGSHPWRFVGVESQEEEEAIVGRIQKEQKDQGVLAASGWGGFAAGIGAGVLDPTLAIPGTWALKGARAARVAEGVASGALLTGAAVAAQEGALQLNQETRTIGESVGAVAGATILGGLLGGAIGLLSPGEAARMAKVLEDGPEAHMADYPGYSTSPKPAGAAAAERPTSEGFAPAVGGERVQQTLGQVGPATRPQFEAELPELRSTVAGLTDGGLRLAGEGTPGGTVENLAKQANAGLYRAIEDLDNTFMEYWYGDTEKKFLGRQRARIGSEWAAMTGSLNGRYSASEFRTEVGKALGEETPHPNEFVRKVAEKFRKEVYDPLWDEWKAVHKEWGKEAAKDEFKAYVNRIYLHDKIVARRPEFTGILSTHFEQNQIAAYAKAQGIVNDLRQRTAEEVTDLQLDPLTRAHTIDMLEKEQAAGRGSKFAEVLDNLREQVREAKTSGDLDAIKLAREYSDKVNAKPQLAAFKRRQAVIARRLRNLRFGGIETRRRIALEGVERVEEQMVDSAQRFASMVEKTLGEFDKLDDAVLDTRIGKLRDRLEGMLGQFDRAEARLRKTANAGDAEELAQRLDALKARISDATLRLDAAKDFNRADARELLTNMIDTASAELVDLNARRAVRREKLLREAADASPEAVQARVASASERQRKIDDKFQEAWQPKLDDLERPDFKRYAQQLADEVTDKILGAPAHRSVGFDLLSAERGPEMSRMLNLPDRMLQDFLERDVEKLAHMYTRTLSPDVELVRRFGSVSLDAEFAAIKDNYADWRKKIEETIPAGPKQEKALLNAEKHYNQGITDLRAIVERLRHQHALPEDPRGLGHRLASVALGINYLRMMGGMTLSSLPDAARVVQRYGVSGAFRDGFAPMVQRLPEFNAMRAAVKDMAVGLDLVLDTRTQLLTELYTDFQSRTKFEKGLEFATSKMGVVSLMAPWNATMKQLVGVMTLSKILRDTEALVAGKASAEQAAFLTENGINARLAHAIWGEMQAGGARQINGAWVPETRVWKSAEARRALNAAVVREADNVIITPGVERPLMTSKILGSPDLAKLLFQFKSYGFSSVTKMLMAGMQQNDIKFYNGMALMWGLGALSWWAKSMAAGGKQEEEMKKAGFARWAAEAVDASGTVPFFGDLNRVAERTPLRGVSRFTGEELTRSQTDNLLGTLLGPSADLGTRVARAVRGFGSLEPTQGDLHNLRLLGAYQNLFWARRGFDLIEHGFNNYFGLPRQRSRDGAQLGVQLR